MLINVARAAVALVWMYQGGWCKLLARCPGHQAIVAGVPFLDARAATRLVATLGLVEVALAAWVVSGYRPRSAAVAQTALLVTMNAGGLLWGRAHITDPGAMITQNFAFLTLVWLIAATPESRHR